MKRLSLVLIALAVGCQDAPSALDHGPEGEMAASSSSGSGDDATPPPAPRTGTTDERLARVEKQMDKVIETLNKVLPPNEPDPNTVYAVPVEAVDPQQGPKDAKVTIVEGFEFLCPYCYMVNPTVDQIMKLYPNDVRVVSKYLIIHGAPAIAPGLAACAAAKQGKYAEMKAALWDHLFKMDGQQPRVQPDQVAPDNIEKIATDIGLDGAKLKTDMDSDACQNWLRDSETDLKKVGANGTPAFYINGRFINGALPLPEFEKVVQEELAKADKAIADGTKQADYYDKIVVGNGVKRVKGRFED
jgi:protein-disulfide isomerase